MTAQPAKTRWALQATWTEETVNYAREREQIERHNKPVPVPSDREGEQVGRRWWGDQRSIPGFIPAPSRRLVRIELIDRRDDRFRAREIPEPLGMVLPAPTPSTARGPADVRAENAQQLAPTTE